MKVVNRNGKVLLHVTDAYYIEGNQVHYNYAGDGIGGCGPVESIQRHIDCIHTWAKSARVEGYLPEPVGARPAQ